MSANTIPSITETSPCRELEDLELWVGSVQIGRLEPPRPTLANLGRLHRLIDDLESDINYLEGLRDSVRRMAQEVSGELREQEHKMEVAS